MRNTEGKGSFKRSAGKGNHTVLLSGDGFFKKSVFRKIFLINRRHLTVRCVVFQRIKAYGKDLSLRALVIENNCSISLQLGAVIAADIERGVNRRIAVCRVSGKSVNACRSLPFLDYGEKSVVSAFNPVNRETDFLCGRRHIKLLADGVVSVNLS